MTIITPSRRQVIIPSGFGLDVRHMRTAAAGNGLLNALSAYWPGNEASGNALDMHTNALHLTDTNTVTSATGKVYALARQYTKVNVEYHTRLGDDALLSAGDVDFTIAAWVRLDSVGAENALVSKWKGVGFNQREYWLDFHWTASNKFNLYVSPDGVTWNNVDTSATYTTNTWYLVIAWHDSVANNINIQVNNGAVDSAGYATGVFDGSAPFQIGAGQGGYTMNGRIGPTMFWKSAASGGGVLTAEQRTALYNDGSGLTYAEFTT